jgi:Zn-dependent protease
VGHIDPVGTIILPLLLYVTKAPFLFGWAKPVPVNFANLRGGRRDMALVALSGPLTNLLLAVASSLIFHLTFSTFFGPSGFSKFWYLWLNAPIRLMARISVQFNLVLMVINLFPILPLDGGRIVAGLVPVHIAMSMERMERYGMLIVLLLIASGIWSYVVGPVIDVFWRILM